VNESGEGNSHVTHGNHADRLPYTEANARCDTAIEALETIGLVNVLERVAHRHLLGAVGVVLLALHLDADHLNGLVPGRETTTEGRSRDLLSHAQLLAVLLGRHLANALLGQTAETEARAPVGHLADGNSIDTLVDATDALAPVNVHEGGPGAGGRGTRCRQLVLGDLDSLHAGTEAHGRVRLHHTARHAADDTAAELASPRNASVVLGLGRHEEEHGALG